MLFIGYIPHLKELSGVYIHNISKIQQQLYLEKLKIHFSQEDFKTLFFIADHYNNQLIINSDLSLAKENLPHYQLLTFIFYNRFKSPQDYQNISVIKEKISLIQKEAQCIPNNFFFPPNFFNF